MHNAHPEVEVSPFQTYGHTFDDLLDAVRTLRKKTIQEAFFWLELPQYPIAPVFAPDAAGEAFFVLPVARTFAEQPSAKELEDALACLRRSARFAASYDSTHRRLAYYPPEAVAELRRSLAPWLVANEQLTKLLFLHVADEVVAARIPRDREAEFLDALFIGFLHTNRKEFKCSVSWN